MSARIGTGSLGGVLAGIAALVVVSIIDLAASNNVVLIGLLIVGPLLASTRSGPRGVLVVSVVALLAALLLAIPSHMFGELDHVTRLLIVFAGSVLAIWIATIRESRERTAKLLRAQAEIARVLTSSGTLVEATPKLLARMGRLLDWRLGALWTVEPGGETLTCVDAWGDPSLPAERFLAETRSTRLRAGEGLPGRVWQAGRPEWLCELQEDPGFSRVDAATRAGFHAALCFPIWSSAGILGAVELFADEARDPDRELVDLMDALGVQLGEYIERKLAEEAIAESEARKSAVVESALDCIITTDSEGRVVEFNPAAERTFGYTAKEAIGRELAELILPPEVHDRYRAELARSLAAREAHVLERRVELRALRKDGSELPVEAAITAIQLDPPMFTAYLRDLSERREVEALQQRLAAIVESSDDAILSKDRDLNITSWNAGAQRLYGYSAEEAVGMPIRKLIPPERHGEEGAILDRVLHEEHIEHYETERMRRDGSRVQVSLTVSPLRDSTGQVVGASVIARDITERKRVEAQRAELLRIEQQTRALTERAERRASFLAEAQALLSSSLDYELTLRNLTRLAVPFIADWCAIDMVAADGSLERLSLAHADPARQSLVDEIEARYPSRPNPERGALKAVLTCRSELLREIPRELIEQAAQDDEHRRLIEQLGLRSAMVVPLLARERALGAITFATAESGRLFDEEDLGLAEDLAARAAIAVDNARLYSERNYIASTLQQSLLPEQLPEIPGVELAARYCAAGEGNDVGGDFYDIYRSGELTWGVAIGDVRGKGPRAAAVTALARYTLRTASLSQSTPSRVLQTLNEAMLRERATDRFCTVAYASIQATEHGAVRMTLAIGGHPLPLLVRSDGSVEPAGTPGTLIGLVPDPDIVDETVELGPGDSLVLYTDGVSEARSPDGIFGEERLVELLKRGAGLDPGELAERIETGVLSFQGGSAGDDLALLVIRAREQHGATAALGEERLVPAWRAPA